MGRFLFALLLIYAVLSLVGVILKALMTAFAGALVLLGVLWVLNHLSKGA